MLAKTRNLFGKSPQTNPYIAVAGKEAGPLFGTRPLGGMVGLNDGQNVGTHLLNPTNLVKTLNSGTIVLSDGHPATQLITTAATIDAVTSWQESKDGGTTVWKRFQVSTTDGIWLRARLKISDIVNTALLFGISNTATANIFGTSGTTGAIGSGITDFIGFHKPNGAGTLAGVLRVGSTSTSQTLTGYALVADTYKILDVFIPNGGGEVCFYVDGVLVYTQTTLTNIPLAATQLVITLAYQTSVAVAKTLTTQRAFGWQENAAA